MERMESGSMSTTVPSRRRSTGDVRIMRASTRPETTTRRSVDAHVPASHALQRLRPPSHSVNVHSIEEVVDQPSNWSSGPVTEEPAGLQPQNTSRTSVEDTSAPTLPQPVPSAVHPSVQELHERVVLLDRQLQAHLDTIDRRHAVQRRPVNDYPTGFRGTLKRVLAFFGYGRGSSRHRKELVSLVWTLSFGFIQFGITLSIIIYSSVHRSPKDPSISEWTACDKPLGLWSVFWILKVMFDCSLSYWAWARDWKTRRNRSRDAPGEVERASTRSFDADLETDLEDDTFGNARNRRYGTSDGESLSRTRRPSTPLRRLYNKLHLLLTLIILSWFLSANILIYTSLKSCRFSAPHLWWLVFSILCIQYTVILQVFVLAIVVFIIGPLIYLCWNIALICLGRHPLQNPHYINPDIGKLPKSVVDQIPLVLYIPPPPSGEKDKDKVPGKTEGQEGDAVTKPEAAYVPGTNVEHTYPPVRPKRRFTFLSRKSSKILSGSDADQSPGTPQSEKSKKQQTWEDCWERGKFPFVRLEENRASCAICLLDFEEPKKRVASEVIKSWSWRRKASTDPKGSPGGVEEAAQNADGPSQSGVQEVPVSPIISNRRSLRLEDVGEGPQPLRLLECGHVFHKTCLDPWLIDVSGRCPTCQQPVTVASPRPRKRDRTRS